MVDTPEICPVILSGGSGTRLWPMSRESYPKQLLPLVSDRSLLQETAARTSNSGHYTPPIVVCNSEHRFVVAQQLQCIGQAPKAILLEPVGRNTAPAAAVAAMTLARDDQNALILLLPSDHSIADTLAFQSAVATAAKAAINGALVTFGIKPSGPGDQLWLYPPRRSGKGPCRMFYGRRIHREAGPCNGNRVSGAWRV